MTTAIKAITMTSVCELLMARATRPLRQRCKIATHGVTILIGCYLYSLLIAPEFTVNGIKVLVTYYNDKRLRYYMNRFVDNNLLDLSGNKYRITAAGIDAVKEISATMDQLVYEFCNKYDIVL